MEGLIGMNDLVEGDGIVVRFMETGDVEAAARLEAEIFTSPWSRQGFMDALAMENAIFLVAVQGERLAGYCGMYFGADEGEITNVAVASSDRCQGIGGLMLEELLTKSRAAGIRQVFLEVRVSNEKAIRLYKKKGFVEAGVRKGFYEHPKEDAYVMMRSQ